MADDLELKMHALRLMRSGNYTRGDALLVELQRVFPEKSMEDIRRAMGTLVEKLTEHRHG